MFVPIPARTTEIPDFHVEERQEGVAAEGAGSVEVGVIGRPSGHDLLVVNQTLAGLAAGAAGDQHLRSTRVHVQLQSWAGTTPGASALHPDLHKRLTARFNAFPHLPGERPTSMA